MPYEDFIEGEDTPLITPVKQGYVFGGWYTTAGFVEGTKCESVPAGTTGSYWVYAKWLFVISEDFSDESEDLVHAPTVEQQSLLTLNNSNIKIGAPNGTDSVFSIKKDENNTPYLHILRGNSAPRIVDNSSGSLRKFESGNVRMEFVFAKEKDENGEFLPFMDMHCRTIAQHDVNGKKLSASNYVYMFKVTDDGAFLAGDVTKNVYSSSNKFAEFDENGVIRVTIELNFNDLTLTGINANGENVVTAFTVPESSGATNGREYQQSFRNYVFFFEGLNDSADSVVRIYSITLTDKY